MPEVPSPNSESARGGLSPDFNLGESIAEGQRNIGEFEMPKAVEAANRLLAENQTDSKTGLLNEKTFKERLATEAEALEDGDILTVYVADLDGFKAVNDELGHDVGDELLDIAGRAFSYAFGRSSDTVAHGSRDSKKGIARLGGDEYAVYTHKKADEVENDKRTSDNVPEPEIQAKRVNEKLTELISGTKFAKFQLKLSIGSAQHQTGEEALTTFAKADLDMFKVKYAGKVDKITDDDKDQLREIIPYMESLGARVESWLKNAIAS